VTRTLLVTGSGGVGKTTIAGSLGLIAAHSGFRTLVLTVDPARRLAQALGVGDLGSEPRQVTAGLDAAMLDPTAAWESVIYRHTDEATAHRVVTSRFFRAVAERFPAGQAYAAAEEATNLVSARDYDVVVVDTPPVGGGADFFEAPREIRSLVAGRALRVLTGPPIPGRRALFTVTARPALRLADRLLGGPLLGDLGEFLVDLRTTYDGVRRRAHEVQAILDEATCVVVTTPDPGPVSEAHELLRRRRSADRFVVLNRVVPKEWSGLGSPKGNVYDQNLSAWGNEALRHSEVEQTLIALDAAVMTVGWRSNAPTTLDELSELGSTAGFAQLFR